MEKPPIGYKTWIADILWSWRSVMKFMLVTGWIAFLLGFIIHFEGENISMFIKYLAK